jgi:hypothetical protein
MVPDGTRVRDWTIGDKGTRGEHRYKREDSRDGPPGPPGGRPQRYRHREEGEQMIGDIRYVVVV